MNEKTADRFNTRIENILLKNKIPNVNVSFKKLKGYGGNIVDISDVSTTLRVKIGKFQMVKLIGPEDHNTYGVELFFENVENWLLTIKEFLDHPYDKLPLLINNDDPTIREIAKARLSGVIKSRRSHVHAHH